MNLLLNTTGGEPGGDLRPRSAVTSEPDFLAGRIPLSAEKEGGSQFSRLLAGKLAESPEGQSGTERTPARVDQREGRIDSNQKADDSATARPDIKGNPDQASGDGTSEQVSENGPFTWSDGDAAWAGAVEPWGGLAGLVQIIQPTGLGSGAIPDISGFGGISVEIRSRLATDIAANFSDRNGLQTLTFKMEPDHLGRVDVRLEARANHLSVRLLAANQESADALRENLKELTEAIQKRTGRFHQVEVRVELKGSEDLDQESTGEDARHSPDRDPQGETREDRGTGAGREGHNTTEVETEPDDRAQGG